jgi:radical SAM enzyme (rSAM/lipoprotein system)
MATAIQRAFFRKFRESETRFHELNYLFWECTSRCNLNCLHCGSDCSKDGSVKDMPAEDFFKALDTVKDPAGNFLVVFTGGEPLLRKDIEACGREIRKRGMRWSLVTNGLLYSKERHNSLLNAGLGALTISLDGTEKNHNWLRNSEQSFRKAVEAIETAAASPRLNFDVVTCVNRRNIGELREIRDHLISLKVKAWRLFTIVPIGRAKNNPDMLLTDNEFVELMEFIKDSRKEKGIDLKFSCEGYVGNYELKVRDSFFFCRAGINIGSILSDGSVSACPNTDRSFAQGNIYRDNFYETWENKFGMFRDREWTRTGKCLECGEYRDCLGNGLHNWKQGEKDAMVCHFEKIIRGKGNGFES